MTDEIVKGCYRRYFRDQCEMIKLRADLGAPLRPSRLFAQGSACSPGQSFDLSEAALRARDRELSRGLIDWLKLLRTDYPEIVEEFGPYLTKAEHVWNGCIAA
jgi:hypothetical protein